jgi:hypothetical protein
MAAKIRGRIHWGMMAFLALGRNGAQLRLEALARAVLYPTMRSGKGIPLEAPRYILTRTDALG